MDIGVLQIGNQLEGAQVDGGLKEDRVSGAAEAVIVRLVGIGHQVRGHVLVVVIGDRCQRVFASEQDTVGQPTLHFG